MELKKKQNLIIMIAIFIIVSTFSIRNYLNKQKVYILSQESSKDTFDVHPSVKASPYHESEAIEGRTEKIVVHIEGEVVSPGVYELEADTRVFDAIEAAGGLLETADRRKINLAKKIEDEAYIYIPNVQEKDLEAQSPMNTLPMANDNDSKQSSLININRANAAELTTLPGIGEVTANRIIEYRTQNGGFKTIEDLKNVSGIGDKKFTDVADKITVR